MKAGSTWLRDTASAGRRCPKEACFAVVVFTVVVLYGLAALRHDTPDWSWLASGEDALSRLNGAPERQAASRDVLTVLHPRNHIGRPARSISMEWNVTKGWRRPDGVLKEVYLINDQFPGPTVEARSGDEVAITVLNSLADGEDGVSIHWHGLKVANPMDGVPGVTQCALERGKALTYRLKIPDDQAGTFWYHSHSSVQRADGLYGALVVHDPRTADAVQYQYTQDRVLQIGDWHHRSAVEVLGYYDDWKNYKIEPVGDSLVLNGKGRFECGMAVPARPVDCRESRLVPELRLTAEKTRLRIANTGTLLGFNVSLAGFSMRVIKTDGGNDVLPGPPVQSLGVLYPGERVDVILERLDERGGRFTISLDETMMQFPNLALTSVQHFPVVTGPTTLDQGAAAPTVDADKWAGELDLSSMRGAAQDLSMEADRTILLYTNIAYLSHFENRPRGRINHTIWQMPRDGQLPLLALDNSEWPQDPAPFVLSLESGQSVDLVINNMDDKPHNFHLHGHDFWVLQQHEASRVGSYEAFNPFESKVPPGGPLNLANPVKKDTVVVPSMGYAVLRFQAQTVGIWMLHCHVLWHESVGMAMAFRVSDREDPRAMEAVKAAAGAGCR